MQDDDAIKVVTPLGGGISEVTSFPEAITVLADAAGVLVEPGRIIHASVRHRSSPESDASRFMRRIEIPVIGREGEITGVLWSAVPPRQDEAAKAVLHDIANLLATIDGGLRLLERQTEVEGRQQIVDQMRHAVQRGAVATRKLFGGSWVQQDETAVVTTRRDLVTAVHQLRYAVGPARSLRTEIADDLFDFAADPEGLYFALLNLCRNASAAVCEDGEVVILAKNSAVCPGASIGAVEIIVADNGCGMTDEVLRRAFDTNFTTKPIEQGSGLGLGHVRQFVEESGGAIEIKSEVGVGTDVRMILPAVSRRSKATAAIYPVLSLGE